MKSEKVIVARKERAFYGNRNGFIKPIFESDGNEEFRPIVENEYPNNGLIFISDYELLDSDIDGEILIMDNCFFVDDDKSYPQKQADPNSSKKRINYNTGISNYFKSPLPHEFIPIYSNLCDIKKSRLISVQGISAKIFFLKNSSNSIVFGPFERDGFDLKAVNFSSYDQDIEEEQQYREFLEDYDEYDGSIICKYPTDDLENFVITDWTKQQFVKDFSKLFKSKRGEIVEFTPISILQNWVVEKITNSGSLPKEILDQIKALDMSFTSSVESLKWNKYIDFLRNIEERNEIIETLISVLYEKGFSGNIAESRELENQQKEIDGLREEIILKNGEIVTLKDKRVELETLLKENEEKKSEIIDSEKFPNLSHFLQRSESELKSLDELIANKHTIDTLNEDIRELKIRKDIVLEDIKKEEDNFRKINDSVRKIKKNFEEDVSGYTAKLAEAKIYTDLLNGINIDNQKNNDHTESSVKEISSIPSELSNPRAYILEIQKRLKNQNRDLTFNDVANLVITTSQSFLTIIAGAPGVGKTSLVSKFANSCGLSDEFGYLEINCSRGWTSSKDLLGFYNPLTGKYQEAKTRLVKAIKNSCKNLNSPYLILLDEANLSPMEHYWSDFIKLADLEYDRILKLSQNESVSFGAGFRFLATINHDHTTEYLSNRLLDRAAIIQIDRPHNINEGSERNDINESIFDYYEVVRLFNETSKWKSDEELIKKFLKQTIEKIESHNNGIIISPRKELAIKRFCKVCTGLMEGNTYTALDYAIAQHILPLLNGRGETFETTLRQLKSDFNDKGMSKSEKLINRIIERGKDLKQFKYIYY